MKNSSRKMTPFDFLRLVHDKKIKWEDLNEDEQKTYNKFIINRALGFNNNMLDVVNRLQGYDVTPKESFKFGDQTIKFQSIEDKIGPNFFSKSATVSFDDGEELSQVVTEKRTYSPSGQLTTEAGIKADLFKDLYVSMGDNLETEIWSFKVQIKPFIRWIWLGAFLVAIGSFFSGVRQIRRI